MKNLKFSRFKIQKISDWNIMDEQNVNIRSNMANFHIYIRGQISITWYVQPIYFSMYTKLSLSSTNLYIKTLFGQLDILSYFRTIFSQWYMVVISNEPYICQKVLFLEWTSGQNVIQGQGQESVLFCWRWVVGIYCM